MASIENAARIVERRVDKPSKQTAHVQVGVPLPAGYNDGVELHIRKGK